MTYFNSIPRYSYNIINTYSHDVGAFTQGLVYETDISYESTGGFGESTLRKVDLKTGEILKVHKLDDNYLME